MMTKQTKPTLEERMEDQDQGMCLLGICQWCVFQTPQDGGYSCVAFPDGIPPVIVDGNFDHRMSFPGDNGIRFVQRADVHTTPQDFGNALPGVHNGVPNEEGQRAYNRAQRELRLRRQSRPGKHHGT